MPLDLTLSMSAQKEFIAVLALAIFGACAVYIWLARMDFRLETRGGVWRTAALWLSVSLLEFYALGPFSFLYYLVDANALTFQYFLSNNHDGGTFVPQIGGGLDAALIQSGPQYVQPEKLLMAIFPIWVVAFLHKLMVAGLGFSGAYLLARRLGGGTRTASAALGGIFTLSHFYLLNFSAEFGTGFAAIPWGVYACVVAPRGRYFWQWTLAAAIILSFAPPTKVFPALLVAVVGGMILSPPQNFRRPLKAFALIVALSVLNWHEVLFGYLLLTPLTARGYLAANDINVLTESLNALWNHLLDIWVPSLLYAISLGVLVRRKDAMTAKAFGVFGWFAGAFLIADLFPWETIGLAFLNRLEHGYMRLAFLTLLVPVAAQALKSRSLRMDLALVALAVGMLIWNKGINVSKLLAFGGQKNIYGYENLKHPTWAVKQDFRVITLFDIPNPNVVGEYYGIDTFDGYALLNPKPWNDYWFAIKRKPITHSRGATRAGLDWRYWNGATFDVGAFLDLDLLRIANVRYILSGLPLKGNGIRLVSAPDDGTYMKVRKSFFDKHLDYMAYRWRRIFEPGEHFIYELSASLPRVFAGSGVETVGNDLVAKAFFRRFAIAALAKKTVVRNRHAEFLAGAGTLRVLSYKKVPDGYDIAVDAPNGGTLVINNHYLPFWKAWANGKLLTIVPANAIHMAIAAPPGARDITVRYSRPLLREKIAFSIRLFK